MDRLNHFITTGNDIIIDLRKNNGRCPKFDEFWEVVAAFIEEKTAVNDRRHNNGDGEGELILNLPMANSYADMYGQCIEMTIQLTIHVAKRYVWTVYRNDYTIDYTRSQMICMDSV